MLLKWHRARRRASDPAFTTARVLEGMALGASVEVDLNPLGDGGWAVLHDDRLDRETTGAGPVAEATSPGFEALWRRANDGRPLEERAATLGGLAAALAGRVAAGACLQLDLKCGDADISQRHVEGFARAAGPLAGHAILSGDDAAAVRRLAASVPGLAVGFDPCTAAELDRLEQTRDGPGFVARALDRMPEARMIYLHRAAVLALDDAGFDVVAAVHAAGRRVDAYTIQAAEGAELRDARRLVGLGVDQITTDDPEGLWAALA